MEGLEAVELKLSYVTNADDNFRIESEFYFKEDIKIQEEFSRKGYDLLGNVALKVTDGTHYTPEYIETGMPFLSALNVKENYLEVSSNYKFISAKEHKELYKRCNPEIGDVLLRKVGVGARYACVIPQGTFEFSLFVSVALIKCKGINPYYLSAFINSKLGQSQLMRFNKGISQPDLHLEDIKKLRLPKVSKHFQEKIEEVIKEVHGRIEQCKALFLEAENTLIQELNFLKWEPTENTKAIKKFSKSFGVSGRLDAEYYQPKYDELIRRLERFKMVSLNQLVSYPICSGSTPKAGDETFYTDAENGIPFIRAVDIENARVSDKDFIYIKPEVHQTTLKNTQLKKNDILFSIAGTVGRCGVFEYDFKANINQACTILRMDESKVMRDYLCLFYNSWVGKLYIEKFARQGVQTNLNLDEVRMLEIPVLPMVVQQEISKQIQKSIALRKESAKLLETAKQAVEIAIEKSEKEAMEFIKGKN